MQLPNIQFALLKVERHGGLLSFCDLIIAKLLTLQRLFNNHWYFPS